MAKTSLNDIAASVFEMKERLRDTTYMPLSAGERQIVEEKLKQTVEYLKLHGYYELKARCDQLDPFNITSTYSKTDVEEEEKILKKLSKKEHSFEVYSFYIVS
jgi:hypothetical protein